MAISICKKTVDAEAGAVAFGFADGTVENVSVSDMPESIQKALILHGMSQKLGDSFAGAKGDVEKAISNFRAVLEQLKKGEWTSRVAGSGAPRTTLLAEAIARISGKELAEVQETIAGLDEDAVKGLKANAQVKSVIADIKAERAKKAAESAGDEAGDILSAFTS